jgi:hypothetical protein
MKMHVAVMLALLPVLFFAEAKAAFDGNALLRSCNEPVASFGYGFCAGYVLGIVQMLKAENSEGSSYYWKACLPQDVPLDHLVDVVKKGLNDYPEKRHQHPAVLILATFAIAFPCPK